MSSFEDFVKIAPTISAIAAAVAAISACTNVVIQNRNIQRNRAVDIVCKKEAEFDSPRMHQHRVRAAKALLAELTDNSSIDAVLDFMESVARFVTKDDVPAEEVWFTFYHWFSSYYVAAKAVIDIERAKDPTYWEDLVKVNALMDKVQRKNGNPIPKNLPADIKKFLEGEATLLDE